MQEHAENGLGRSSRVGGRQGLRQQLMVLKAAAELAAEEAKLAPAALPRQFCVHTH